MPLDDLEYIEGQSPLDEDEREGLLVPAVETWADLNEYEEINIQDAVQWTLQSNFKVETVLTQNFVREVHRRMFGDVWSWAGEFRRSNKNIGVDWPVVPVELKTLLDDCRYWINQKTYPPDELAVRLKHRMVCSHPFPNGNGRHSRLMADIVITHIFRQPVFSWGAGQLGVSSENRTQYLQAIYEANEGDISGLVAFSRR